MDVGYDDGKLDAIRNPDGIWINSDVFRGPAKAFQKRGYYIPDPEDSPAWHEYWDIQRRRCIFGYEVGGVRITGYHYFYLNFCPIKKSEEDDDGTSKKGTDFPDFWDGDYNYFWAREIAHRGMVSRTIPKHERPLVKTWSESEKMARARIEVDKLKLELQFEDRYLLGGYNIIVGKARRKGYSFKAGAITACNFYMIPDSITLMGAAEKKFLYPSDKGLYTKTRKIINFNNEHCAWGSPCDVLNSQNGQIRNSWKEKNSSGIELEVGIMSEIGCETFQSNPDAFRGSDALEIFFEESGAFGTPGLLKDSYRATEDCVKDGMLKTGMITIFGTSGDMEGGTADYADMFSRPAAFNLLPCKNIWDEDSEDENCGFFHPFDLNLPKFYDAQGNSLREEAKSIVKRGREEKAKAGATSPEIQKGLQERPLSPDEAFASSSVNIFPVTELRAQLKRVKAKNWQNLRGTPVKFYREQGKVKAKAILDGSDKAITSLYSKQVDISGTPMIYEKPVDNAEKGLYKIGYDPVRQDTGTSYAGIVVYKSHHVGSVHHHIVVAEYIGRLDSTDDIDEMSCYFAEYYNTEVMHENEVAGVKTWFIRHKKVQYLAAQPQAVIDKNIKNSKVARIYGCHMNEPLKDAGERYVKEWLNTILDYVDGKPVTVVSKIYSIRLLEELIAYNRKGNFDLVSALFMCMFQVQEEVLDKTYGKEEQGEKFKKLERMIRYSN